MAVPDPIVNLETEVDDRSVLENESDQTALADQLPTPTVASDDSRQKAEQLAPVQNDADIAPQQKPVRGGGLQGRATNARASLASRFGGTPQSEAAVEQGLKWLANHQFHDGSWRLNFPAGPCQGRCKNRGQRESTTAATGLALMAFLGAGYTHQSGRYQQNVQAGIDYLTSRMRKTYFGGNLAEGSMYAQGIATIALGEAFAMTGDPQLEATARSALEYILTAQHSQGGWRYTPGEPGDMTVTGWQLMALKSCELAKLDVPAEKWRLAKQFIDSLGESGGGFYGYQNTERQPTTTAIGLLMQMYMGWNREHEALQAGMDFLLAEGPSETNVYFNYYATQVLHLARHSSWNQWNSQLRELLVATQDRRGHQAGSWHFSDEYGNVGGRLYTTAMCIMILEVYYRYLPLYDHTVLGELDRP